MSQEQSDRVVNVQEYLLEIARLQQEGKLPSAEELDRVAKQVAAEIMAEIKAGKLNLRPKKRPGKSQ